jgi:thiosulfate reductase cytochrome b subunit
MTAQADSPVHAATVAEPPKPGREVIYRHTVIVRLTHWLNVVVLFFMLGSGLNIFNAHPRLYWGKTGTDGDPAWLSIHGGWPHWLTIPGFQDLADARHWHFLFAWALCVNGLAYLIWSLSIRHLQRDLVPTGPDLKGIPRSIADHAQLKHPTGDAAKRYNVLQRLAYLGVIFLIVLMICTGLTLSPGFNSIAPWMLELFGGRQSARSIHFISASLIVLFVLVHLIEVVLAGPINEIRSIITGRYVVPTDAHAKGAPQ